jgi:transcriptional regulator with XRE-family HTH domain
MTDEKQDLNEIIAKNIAAFRKANGMTQLDVAQTLNYTDKAVSKWERGESLPDVATLMRLAELFRVSLDDLVTSRQNDKMQQKIRRLLKSHKLIIPFLSAGLVLLTATVVFVFLSMLTAVPAVWLSFVYAVPVALIVLLVFNAIWGSKILSSVIVSLLAWSLPACIVLTDFGLPVIIPRAELLFIIPVPLQLLIGLWYFMRIRSEKAV